MHRLLLCVACLVAPCFLACGPGDAEVCGVSSTIPEASEVADGMGSATRDGSDFQAEGSWGPGPNASVDIGTLSIVIAYDETGTETTELISRRAFPICVPLGERSPAVGSATFDGSYLTDASHTGAVAILTESGGILSGRFAVDLVENNTGAVTSFTDGAFRIERR